jgi:Protein of unknown function (DUF3995)
MGPNPSVNADAMAATITTAVVAAFALLSLIHCYWALGGRAGKSAAIPQVSNRPAFTPSAFATFAVAIGLALCALLVAATARWITSPLPANWLRWLCFALALGLLGRAVGDFRLVGFFKRVRGTAFARLDTLVYAPLCLVLSVGVFSVAASHGV